MPAIGRTVTKTIFDPLDLNWKSHHTAAREEEVHLATALLILYLLRGRTPLISQTQAFDSPALLATATADSTSAYLRWLVTRGHIRVALFNRPTLLDAFVAALDNPSFVFLSWPELNSPNPVVDRAELKHAVRHWQRRSGLPDGLQARLEALVSLDRAVSKTRHRSSATLPRVKLSTRITAACHASEKDSPLGQVLQRLSALNSNEWSRHSNELGDMNLPNDLRAAALTILDSCYDMVVGDSLRADEKIIRTSEKDAVDVVHRISRGSILYEGRVSLDTPDVQTLERVGWREVTEFMKRAEELSMTERERLAEALHLLVRVASEEGESFLGFAPQVDGLWQGLGWGGLGGGVAAALTIAGAKGKVSRRKVLSLSFLAGFLPAYVTRTVPVRRIFETKRIASLERRYQTILLGAQKRPGPETHEKR